MAHFDDDEPWSVNKIGKYCMLPYHPDLYHFDHKYFIIFCDKIIPVKNIDFNPLK